MCTHAMLTELHKERERSELTSSSFLCPGFPQGFSPPEKLGKLRQTMDLTLYIKENYQINETPNSDWN